MATAAQPPTEDMDQVEVGGQSASPRPPWPPVSWGRREPLLLRYWVVGVVAEVVVEEEVRVRKRRSKNNVTTIKKLWLRSKHCGM